MRVLFITLAVYSRLGGIERFNQRVVRCLSELSGSLVRENRVLALWDRPEDRRQSPPGVAFEGMSSSKVRAALAFARRVWRFRPDVILYGHVLLTPLAALARALSPRSRNLMFAHGLEVWGDSFREVPAWERRHLGRLIDRVLPVSAFTKTAMQRVYGLPDDRFRRVFCAVDLNGPGPGIWRRESRPVHLLTVGRLSHQDRYKGCDNVIRALPAVLGAFPDLVYEIVGEGPLRADLEELAERVGVTGRVVFLGRVSDLELDRAYQRADVFVMPSKKEGFGIVFLEAWKHGLPVIAGNVDASAEIISDGVNGRTVDPESVSQIGNAILEVLRNRDVSLQMGRNGFETVRRNYTHERFRERLAEILSECAACAE